MYTCTCPTISFHKWKIFLNFSSFLNWKSKGFAYSGIFSILISEFVRRKMQSNPFIGLYRPWVSQEVESVQAMRFPRSWVCRGHEVSRKLSLYRPWGSQEVESVQAMRFPESWGTQISRQSAQECGEWGAALISLSRIFC
jgi:hypothetical protein